MAIYCCFISAFLMYLVAMLYYDSKEHKRREHDRRKAIERRFNRQMFNLEMYGNINGGDRYGSRENF